MSKRQQKISASGSRAASTGMGSNFGQSKPTFGSGSSKLSYLAEPPDFGLIPNANVVAFKNLMKKDSTTKAKALEDISSSVAKSSDLEEGVLVVWVDLFPRISIDNSRRVRQLAYTVQGQIFKLSGKRVVRFMPDIAASWLAGLYDGDKLVSRTAHDSLHKVFPSQDKIHALRKLYQKPILELCRDVLENETSRTLSDERSVSPDDAEAKYARVLVAFLGVLRSTVTELSSTDLGKEHSLYEDIFSSKKLWGLSVFKDALVRNSTYRLLTICVDEMPAIISENLDRISKDVIYHATGSDQSNSTIDLTDAMSTLTITFPTVWTEHYSGKKAVLQRLQQFFGKGSQYGSAKYWSNIDQLIKVLPNTVLPSNAADAISLLNALHDGILKKEELRSNIGPAYLACIDIADYLCTYLKAEDRLQVWKEAVIPLLSQYVNPDAATENWNLPGNAGAQIAAKIVLTEGLSSVLEPLWKESSAFLVDKIKASAPEQSKEFERSQTEVIKISGRWVALQKEVLQRRLSEEVRAMLLQSSRYIVDEALKVIAVRKGKPYSAADVVLRYLQSCPDLILEDEKTKDTLFSFVENDMQQLLFSASVSQLSSILYQLVDERGFETLWIKSAQTIMNNAPSQTERMKALRSLLESPHIPKDFDIARTDSNLESLFVEEFQQTLDGNKDQSFVKMILRRSSQLLSESCKDKFFNLIVSHLSESPDLSPAFDILDYMINQKLDILRDYSATEGGARLLKELLLLNDVEDEHTSQRAITASAAIQGNLGQERTFTNTHTISAIVSEGLREASESSLNVQLLAELACQVMSNKGFDNSADIKVVLPDERAWKNSLDLFTRIRPGVQQTVCEPFGGVIFTINSESSSNSSPIPRDGLGYSIPYRNALFLLDVLKNHTSLIERLQTEYATQLIELLLLTAEVANNNVNTTGDNDLWNVYNEETETEAVDFIAGVRSFVSKILSKTKSWWIEENSTSFSHEERIVKEVIEKFGSDGTNSPTGTYQNRKCFAFMVSQLIEVHGCPNFRLKEAEEKLRAARKKNDSAAFASLCVAYKDVLAQSQVASRIFNELVVDATEADTMKIKPKALAIAIPLNALLANQPGILEKTAKQRIVFLCKNLSFSLRFEASPSLKTELCKGLLGFIPSISDLYESLWEDLIAFLLTTWSNLSLVGKDLKSLEGVPLLHVSLKLYETLRSLSQDEETNDDLKDGWKASEKALANTLISVLKKCGGLLEEITDIGNLPLKIVNQLLARQIRKSSLEKVDGLDELFPLLCVSSTSVQQTAFDLLHKAIPAAQEQISFDSALDKRQARLPDELLSLLLEPPSATETELNDAGFEEQSSLRSYLLSWLLVFDHFENSSYKVKEDYVEHIKDGEYANDLLEFIFYFLGFKKGKSIDISKTDVRNYVPDTAESPSKDVQWLLAHLYFLCLKYLPSVTKNWWLNSKPRQLSMTVESWTEKYISPHIISDALAAVSDWAATQDQSSEEDLNVKVSQQAKEITASYVVDEQTMSIAIRLPGNYPLRQASVEGVHRVAVEERKWQSWLISTQGVITFSNGNLVDGLTSWRRNVVGALKGHIECAICYSIISVDKQLPSKRCGTCKNLFHSSCLFKWFKSSNASSCPLCRNPFNYG